MSSKIDENAQVGFANASSYDQHRPSYPTNAVTNLLKQLGVLGLHNARILDLAAGTGKFTSLLSAREEEYEIIAIEPHPDMRSVLGEKSLKGVTAIDGMGEDMKGVESEWADAVICAQAFHWFPTMAALQEIHRTINPGGSLGLIWNFDDYNARVDYSPATVWEARMRDLITSCAQGPNLILKHSEWPKVFDEQLKVTPPTILATADPLFSLPLGAETVKWTLWLSKEALWARIRTISHMSILEGQKLEEVRGKAFEILEDEAVETNEHGEIAVHGQTESYWTTAIPGAPLKAGG